MALLFEYSQSNGCDISALFALQNISMAKEGIQVYGERFIKKLKCDSTFDKYPLKDLLPTQVLQVLLDTAYDSCDLESDSSSYGDNCHEVFSIQDNLFSLIESDAYLDSELASKVDAILYDIGIMMSSDLHLFLESEDTRDEDETDFLDRDDLSELIKSCIKENEFAFELYYSECICELGSLLVALKENLVAVEEELKYEHYRSARIAA